MAKLGIVYATGVSGWLAKTFTGTTARHTFWQTPDAVYEMLYQRKRNPVNAYASANVKMFDFPQVTKDFLEMRLTNDDNVYGVLDFLAFFVRPVLRLFKVAIGNKSGEICSEMVNNDLRDCGVETPWLSNGEPPSPADFDRWLSK